MQSAGTYAADSFLRSSRSFLGTSTSIVVLDCPRSMLTYFSGAIVLPFFFSFETLRGATGADLGSIAWRRASRDLPRECPVPKGSCELPGRSYCSNRGFCGRGEESTDSLLWTRRSVGVEGAVGAGFICAKTCDDLRNAALTEGSIVASFGRSVDGI